ncbi:MAG: translation initiation factor eIF-1A [Candidatus Aenigmarchaeota archaeon]|nr:translation initiation factor eIF-1A [Candidatus Aenigmarchaeota archaeon]
MPEGEQPFRVRMPRGREVLGVIESMLGVNKIRVRCQDNKVRIVRIPGRLRKRIWMKENDIVLVEPWEIQKDKSGDVIWKYSPTEASWLRRKGILKI